MTSPHLSYSIPFIRLVCLLVCYSLVSPFIALVPETGIVIARTDPSSARNMEMTNTPRKSTSAMETPRWRDGELLVRFKRDVAASDIDILLQSNGARRVRRLRGQSKTELLRLIPGSDPEAIANILRSSQLVDFAEPNYLITADQITPNDPRFTEQWALKNTVSSNGPFSSDINASQAWEGTTGSRRTVIAVLDSGIDFTHPDLRNNEWTNSLERANNTIDDDDNGFVNDLHGWDFVTDTNEIKDEQGHGTGVAGIVDAQGNNATGITGVMWRAGLMSVRVLDSTGTGDIARAVEAIDYAVNNGAQVINCSWGTDDSSIALLEAINWASRKGVVVVTSAGNNSRDVETAPRFPASFDLNNLISVASTDNNDVLTSFSNFGATHVTVAAPGINILTTKNGGDYQTVSGSSASAPFVTGVAGLVKTLRPWLSADLTRAAILRSSRQVPALSGKVASGGVINASGALNALTTLSIREGRDSTNGNNGGEHPINDRGDTRGNRNGIGAGNDNGANNVSPIPPTSGRPGSGFPNLDALRRRQPTSPRAPVPIQSRRRSRRNSSHPPNGRRVGDRLSALDASDFYPLQYSPREQMPDLLALASDFSPLDSILGSHNTLVSDSPFSLSRQARYEDRRLLSSPSRTKFILELFPMALLLMPQASPSKIAFASNRDGSAQIYSMNSDGSDQTRLTNNGSNDESPKWSPDNTRILFQSDRDNPFSGAADIYVMNWDGSAQTRLTSDAADDSAPVWSPDGTKIAFQSARSGTSYQVYVMNADGSGQVNISNNTANDTQPSWSPDGTKIAFASDRDQAGFSSIYVMNANGSNQTRLTVSGTGLKDDQPAWSPDGTKLAFTSTRDSILETWQETDDEGGILNRSRLRINKEVYLMNADGSNQIRLTNILENDDSPGWSADGTKIAFRSERERDWWDPIQQVWVMNADGSNQVDLSNNWSGDYTPNWQRMTGNVSPSVSITSPASAATFTAPANITINASANDSDGIVSRVDFYQGATLIGTDTTSPYSVTWSNVALGSYAITAKATDNAGATTTSTAVNITVNNNQLPTANAGGSYTGETTQSFQFNGGSSSDPDGTITGYSWNFGDGTTGTGVSPTHAYATPNTYTVTLTVTDNNGGQASATTTATIRTTVADQYVRDFHQLTLARQPNSAEQTYWNDILRKAYVNGQDSKVLASRELGRTTFDSAEYAARQRSDHDFVRDLYRAYLHREPDQPSWDIWTSWVPTQGRENIRNGFAYSAEFANVVALLLPNGTASSAANLLSARVDPKNRTGTGGEDLLSRNYNWSVPLLGLPGRAGMNLGLSLSYNSLVWTKSGPYIYFDEDNGSVSPGFRVDFPSIQGRYFNAAISQNAYLLITSSGAKVELRQVGTSNVYESADSSYMQLVDSGNLVLKTTDGTQLIYVSTNNEYRCTEVKDRNGNVMTINRNGFGQISTIIDTLARTITFNYDANQNLSTITQSWTVQGQTVTHQWATFTIDDKTIQTGFSPQVVGLENNAAIAALTQVRFDDGTRYDFGYNSYGQVSLIKHFAEDNHLLSSTSYTLPSDANDCPRLTERRVSAEKWTGENGVPAEVATQYGMETDGACKLTAPDGTVYKEYYGTAWQAGLTTQTEVWSGGAMKKWTATAYTQDDTNLNYQKNPRVTETNIFDSDNNRKRTTIEYGPYAQWGLPYLVKEYAADGVTPIRHTFTDYNLSQPYLDRHIIGLISAVHMSDGAWQVKTGFEYDAGGDQLQATAAAPTQHDGSYSTSFTARGNLTLISRYDVNDIGNESKKLITRMGYDTDGSPVFTRDHLGHQSNLIYSDSFSEGVNHNTFAYPTKATPPLETGENAENFSSTTQYSYQFGSVTRTKGPVPAGQTLGAEQTFEYDSVGRLKQINNLVNNAYRKWVYDPDGSVSIFDTIKAGAPDLHSAIVYDGLGRVRATSKDNPGSAGLFTGQTTVYDVMGRVFQQNNPTEMDADWNAAGEDAAGWVGTQQLYDWNGRPTVTTNPDGTTKVAEYGGCGCAGGQVVTLSDEGTLIGSTLSKRQQKVFSDSLGRAYKNQTFNWDGSIYSTSVTNYNARDQIKSVKVYQGSETLDGSCPTGTCQESATDYDGYGRRISSKAPEQISPTNFTYNLDDTTSVVTDSRGATTTFGYDVRHQVKTITYGAPAGVTNSATVSFEYDPAGNRTLMSDGLGSTTYSYDRISRLISETRNFTGVGSFTLGYTYNLAGQLTSTTDPTNVQVIYDHDHTGRLTSVTGAGGGASTYASNMQYRAWGALKHLSYGNNLNLDLTYNNRLKTTKYDLVNTGSGARVMGREYQYTTTPTSADNDGKVKYSHDLVSNNLDRTYSYDHTGDLQSAKAGVNNGGYYNGPFEQAYGRDVWDNLVSRSWRTFSSYSGYTYPQLNSHGENYVNNKNTDPNWQYDSDGRLLRSVTGSTTLQYTFDSAGRISTSTEPNKTLTHSFDGDGQRIKLVENATTTYYVRSSALGGQVVSEVSQGGVKQRGYVTADGAVLAKQESNQVFYEHADASGSSNRTTDQSGAVTSKVETDPLGTKTDDSATYNYNGATSNNVNPIGFYGNGADPRSGCGSGGMGMMTCMGRRRPLGYGIGILRIDTPVTTSRTSIQLRSQLSSTSSRIGDETSTPTFRGIFFGQAVTTTTTTIQSNYIFVGNLFSGYSPGGGTTTPPVGPPTTTEPQNSQRPPCNLPVPLETLSQGERDVVNVVMHENTAPAMINTPSYQNGDRWRHPTGPTLDWNNLQREAFFIASAVVNYANARHGGNLSNAVMDNSYINDGAGGHLAAYYYQRGNANINEALTLGEGSDRCNALKRAIIAATFATQLGDQNPYGLPANLQHWRGRVPGTMNAPPGAPIAGNSYFVP